MGTLSQEQLHQFMFEMYSEDGAMHQEHIEDLCCEMFTNEYHGNPAAVAVREELGRLAGGEYSDYGIDIQTWEKQCEKEQLLMMEVINYQFFLRNKLSSTHTWKKAEERRLQKYCNKWGDATDWHNIREEYMSAMAVIKAEHQRKIAEERERKRLKNQKGKKGKK